MKREKSAFASSVGRAPRRPPRALARLAAVTLGVGASASVPATAAASPDSFQAPPERKAARPGDVALKRRLFLDFETAYFLAHLSLPRAPGGATLASSSAGFVGFRRIPLGFGVAFAPSDILVVGMSFQAALEPEPFTAPGGSARSLRLGLRGGLAPFVEVLFLRRRDVRPFVQVRGGFSVEQAFLRAPGQRAFAMEQALEVAPTIGVSWGAHAFVSEDISVDASITLDHRWNFRRGAWRPEEIPATDEAPVDVELRGWRIGDTTLTAALVVGFSRWF